MCTVSAISCNGGLRVVCSRDESLGRVEAHAPEVREVGRLRAVWPSDPQGGGTWIAANEAGLVATLMNVNPVGGERVIGQKSRGVIIPGLMGCRSIGSVIELVASLDVREYAPFRLLLWAGKEGAEVVGDGEGLHVVRREQNVKARVWSSSSLGDLRVIGVRSELFWTLVNREAPTAASQDRFHAHRWRERLEVSVRMEREDARTVSVTTVEVSAGGGRCEWCIGL